MEAKEELREGTAIKLWLNFGENICPQCKSWKLCPHKQLYLDGVDYLFSYLDKWGVVRKVDGELPNGCLIVRPKESQDNFSQHWNLDCVGWEVVGKVAGCVAVERLIE